ncbi:MAG TPA: hypothetical protein VIX12_05210, partial [Candidatus Binataceae bacterium]
ERHPMGQRAGHGARAMVTAARGAARAQPSVRRAVVGGPLVLAAMLSLGGCAAGSKTAAPPTVDIPIASPIYCKVPALTKPAMPIAALKPDSPPADTVRSYAASIVILKAAVDERDALLAGCAGPDATTGAMPADNSSGAAAGVPPAVTGQATREQTNHPAQAGANAEKLRLRVGEKGLQ